MEIQNPKPFFLGPKEIKAHKAYLSRNNRLMIQLMLDMLNKKHANLGLENYDEFA